MYRCHHCQVRMELRKKHDGVLWICMNCERAAATMAAWQKAHADDKLLNTFVKSGRSIRPHVYEWG